jgi:hypothetical protein
MQYGTMSLIELNRSISAGCLALASAVEKTSAALNAFVRDVRESRSDLDALSGDLHSLEGILSLMKEDAASFPPKLAVRTPTVLQHCTAVVNELEGYVTILNSADLSRQAKKLRWAATKSHMSRIQSTLDGYKSTLGLALDLVACTSPKHDKDSGTDSPGEPSDVKDRISETVAEIGRLSTRLQGDVQKSAALRTYLDALQAHADEVSGNLDHDAHASRAGSSSSISDAPDSAIEINDDPFFRDPVAKISISMPLDEVDELLDELREMPASPPVPPRNVRRSMSMNKGFLPMPPVQADVARPTTAHSDIRLVPNAGDYQFITKITAGPPLHCEPPPVKRGLLSRMFSTRKRSNTSSNPPISSAASMQTIASRPSTASIASDKTPEVARRPSVSRRLSSSIKGFPMFKVEEEDEFAINSEPNAIFGVSLAKSIQVAHGSARTRHTEGGKSSRDFPLCIYKCTQFIGKMDGAKAPEIFGEAGDAQRRAALRTLFSSGPTYGDDIDWDWFTVYEAADLILIYLSELPKPLITESVAKRWISLSRQATITSGSRTDQCIDFWEEALLGVRGQARNLLKLLLNLWADIAEAADENGMTAERLAAKILQPLMHTDARTYTTDYMLSLAFLIRKRCEYMAVLQGNQGRSKAAF